MKNYYKTKNDLFSSPLRDRIGTLLYLNAKTCEQNLKNIISSKNSDLSIDDIKERNINIGALVSGEAYYHETDQYYHVIGFMVESEFEYKGNRTRAFGFRSIYFSPCHDFAPVDFDEGSSLDDKGRIGNGFGDYVEIDEEIVSKDEVEKCINENYIDINKYLRELNLLLLIKEEKKNNSLNPNMEF